MEAQTQPTRETQLRDAINKARIPPRDYRVFHALFRRATYGTAMIAPRFQPKSIKAIARDAKCSEATVKRSLAHLELHGWITRARHEISGRGYRTTYVLLWGRDCDCKPERPEPKSDAERARSYRQRKKLRAESGELAHVPVTDELAQIPVTESGSNCRDGVAQIDVSKRLASRDEATGQAAFSTKSVRWRGEGKSVVVPQAQTDATPTDDAENRICPVCGIRIWPALAAQGWSVHPGCGVA